MDIKKLTEAFKGLNLPKITPPAIPTIEPFVAPEINYDALADIESPFPDIIDKLDENNKQLRQANDQLISTLQEQHNTNVQLQHSNSRISKANLVLVAISLIAAIGAGIQNYISSTRQLESTEQVLTHTTTISALQSELSSVRQELTTLREEHEQLKQQTDTNEKEKIK